MFERLTLTEIELLLIVGALVAICIYAGRMLHELRSVNYHLHALRDNEDWLRARVERELLAFSVDRPRGHVAKNGLGEANSRDHNVPVLQAESHD